MKNITLKVDDAVLDRVRHVAVDEHKSVSKWVQDVITHELDARDQYEQDRKGALLVLRDGLLLGGSPLTREEAHER
jgi:predicted transcriptional regulator